MNVIMEGKLASELEIAVRRPSKNSDQGMSEFVNEVKLIAGLRFLHILQNQTFFDNVMLHCKLRCIMLPVSFFFMEVGFI